MGVLSWFAKPKFKRVGTWKELGSYNARFTAFGNDLYASDIVRSCIRPLAEHSAKANAVSTDASVAKLLNTSPNMYMNGKDFLYKVRTKLEIQNTAFIYIMRDDRGRASGFYPVPYSSFEALEYNEKLFIQFNFNNAQPIVIPWDDLAVLRKDYNSSDIAGDDNTAILNMLELVNTTNQGIGNAVKSTANLRGILKNTKGMLSDEDVKKQKERFVRDYLSLENDGGIASLDSSQEFTPITMSPAITSWETMKEFRENIYRYFGISDSIITSNYTEVQMEAFYESRIEPFLVALSTELTRKVFTERERGFGARITYESNRIQYMSTSSKLALVQLVDRALMTPNEYRAVFNLAPYEGGDEFVMRLDTDKTGDVKGEEDEQTE